MKQGKQYSPTFATEAEEGHTNRLLAENARLQAIIDAAKVDAKTLSDATLRAMKQKGVPAEVAGTLCQLGRLANNLLETLEDTP